MQRIRGSAAKRKKVQLNPNMIREFGKRTPAVPKKSKPKPACEANDAEVSDYEIETVDVAVSLTDDDNDQQSMEDDDQAQGAVEGDDGQNNEEEQGEGEGDDGQNNEEEQGEGEGDDGQNNEDEQGEGAADDGHEMEEEELPLDQGATSGQDEAGSGSE